MRGRQPADAEQRRGHGNLRALGETLAFLRQPEPPGGWREAFDMLPLVNVDFVLMEGAAAGHTHVNGEINLGFELEGGFTGAYEAYLRSTLPGLAFAPIAFVSALRGTNLLPLLQLAGELHDQAGERVTTGELNRVLRRALEKHRPRPRGGRVGRVLYGSQVSTHPPTVLLFVSDAGLFDDNWRRFLLHELQAELPYSEVPIRLLFQSRGPRATPGPGARDSSPEDG